VKKQPNLSQLIEQARRVHMTAEQLESQKRDFAYGNTKFENDAITREMIDEAADARLRH
jgi:hypothetical protein